MPFEGCYQEVEYYPVLWYRFPSYTGRVVQEVSLDLVVVSHLFHLFLLIGRLDHWWGACEFACRRLSTHQRLSMMGWHNVYSFATSPAPGPIRYILGPSSWHPFKGHCLMFGATPPVFSHYSNCIVQDHAEGQPICNITISELPVCTCTAFLIFARDDPASAEGRSGLPRTFQVCSCHFLLSTVIL